MSIELVRIDDRLIHGQVVMAWHRACPVDRMVVVDDRAANDAIRKMLLETVAPQGVRVSVLTKKQGADALLTNAYGEERLMLLATTPITLLALIECGVDLKAINVGGLGTGPGKRQLTPAVAVDQEEEAAFAELQKLGVQLQIQTIPSDLPLALSDVLPKREA
ncbi:PTS sugar transporter subunit IIB [Azotosporobacter soli]|uniref:PTS system mannose/fructose/N-acetylgalactosamine-transporter subunit IIB n=1 Tax=Azotosporobacter soli TaxID=3055040 RepID=UPI0031FEBD79